VNSVLGEEKETTSSMGILKNSLGGKPTFIVTLWV